MSTRGKNVQTTQISIQVHYQSFKVSKRTWQCDSIMELNNYASNDCDDFVHFSCKAIMNEILSSIYPRMPSFAQF